VKVKINNYVFECEKIEPIYKNCLHFDYESFYKMKNNPNRIFVKLKTKYMYYEYMSFDITQVEIIDIKKDRMQKLERLKELNY